MHFRHVFKSITSLLAVVILALPLSAASVSAAPAPTSNRLDAEVTRRLQTTNESQRIPVIVEGAADVSDDSGPTPANDLRARRAETRVRNGGGQVLANSNLLGATVADLTPAQIRALSNDSSVQRVTFDAPVQASALRDDDADDAPTISTSTPIVFNQTIGATDAWRSGQTGRGVTVAILDTGIDDNNRAFGGRVKARVDLITPRHPVQGDPAGHGTHVAGIVAAGRNAPSPGVAPDANLVSVRVLDANGNSRLSTVILGLEWVVAHRAALGIDVVVMALGAPAQDSYHRDPLAAAAEMAWHSGIVVVTAAGNNGPNGQTVQTPGIDPLVLTVGASDDAGTVSRSDDSLPTWSSVGPTADGVAKPDLVAPGRKIVSVRVPGSTLDLASPTHVEGPTTIRFSGTSEATAVTGGAVALLLQQRPDLNPDEIKALLIGAARPLAGVSRAAQGAGNLDVARALSARTPRDARQHVVPSEALVRTMLPVLREVLRHNRDLLPQLADRVLWDRVLWDRVLWDRVLWDRVLWDRVLWDRVLWDRVLWDRVLWDRVLWDQATADRVLWDQTVWD